MDGRARKDVGTILLSIFVCILAALTATKYVYDQVFGRYDPPPAPVPPALVEMVENRQLLSFPSGENTLQGYLYQGTGDTLVVLVPGFSTGADSYLWPIRSLLDYGYGVFAFDPTGACRSGGDSAVGFPQTITDLEAALTYLQERGSLGYRHTVLFGHSRGGYAVCCVLGRGFHVAGAVSVSGVNSAMEGILAPAVEKVGPVAKLAYPMVDLYQSGFFSRKLIRADAARSVSRGQVPVLMVHGAGDTIIPLKEFSLYSHRNQITSPRAEYIVCARAGQDGHTSLLYSPRGGVNTELMAQINGFFARCTGNLKEREQYNGRHRTDSGLQTGRHPYGACRPAPRTGPGYTGSQ